jgi:hypothetical protein
MHVSLGKNKYLCRNYSCLSFLRQFLSTFYDPRTQSRLYQYYWKTQCGEEYADECISGGKAFDCELEGADYASPDFGDVKWRAQGY